MTWPGPCPCECNSGGFCGGCGHAGCGGRRKDTTNAMIDRVLDRMRNAPLGTSTVEVSGLSPMTLTRDDITDVQVDVTFTFAETQELLRILRSAHAPEWLERRIDDAAREATAL